MVKLVEKTGGSEEGKITLCSAALPDTLKMNGNALKTVVNNNHGDKLQSKHPLVNKMSAKRSQLVNGSNNKMSENEIPVVNGSNDKMSENEIPVVNGSNKMSENEIPVVNGSNKMSENEIPVVNGCKDQISAKEVLASQNSINKMLVNDVVMPTVNGNFDDFSIVNRNNNENNGSYLNGSNTLLENSSYSNFHISDSLCEDNSDGNHHGFIEVVNKKKRNKKNKNKNHSKKPISNLPPGLKAENLKRDSDDKDSGEREKSPTHLSQKPPSRNFAAIRSSEKSYSSVLVNGQNGNEISRFRNDGPNISNIQPVTKCTDSNECLNNTNLSGINISINKILTDLTKSVIKDTSAASCKQCNLSTKLEMTDVSAQTDVSSQIEKSTKKECLSSHQGVIPESNQINSPSDFVNIGEIDDESSNAAYSDSVVSNDSGRGDSEITYDESIPYCCEFPREKTSQLIGRGGKFKYEIERKSGVKLWVYSHEFDMGLNIICMTGTGAQVEKAKELIKERFRHVTLRQWLGFNPINPPLSERYLPILPECTDFMAVVSCICDPTFFWVQQYGHPHLYLLEDLERRISDHFNTVPDAPGIDNPTIGSIIAVPSVRDGDNIKWIRGWIINIIPEDEKVVVRYLDHGGDHLVPISDIRPMRHDFLSMPFFAAQCSLYDILPTGGVWSDEARAEFTRLCNGSTCPPIVRVVWKTPECYFVTMFGYDSEINAQVDIASHLVTKGFGVRPCISATEFPSEIQQ